MGIPTILIAEYLEEEPLAKMEWVKVFGALYDRTSMAMKSLIRPTENINISGFWLRELATNPAVLLGLPWRGNWFISGGKSYVARLVEDAGGEYIFKQLILRTAVL